MHSFAKVAAVAGLSFSAVVSAAPAYGDYVASGMSMSGGAKPTPSQYQAAPSQSGYHATYSQPAPIAAPSEVSPDGNKFRFPLSNGFPNPNQAAINATEVQAQGTLSNAPPPPAVSKAGLGNFRLIAFNELFEVAFFTSLLSNITNNVPGFTDYSQYSRDFLIETIATVQAQEELHALTANGVLAKFNAGPILPCEYTFPTTNLKDAIALAATFTDVVLGTLQDANQVFAINGDNGAVRAVSSVIGQEGEQDGFYRIFQGKRPSAQPFLTTSTADFAFSALNQNFVVPGSCPNINELTADLKIFDPLMLAAQPSAVEDSTLHFSFKAKDARADYKTYSLVYINGQNLPVVEPLQNVQVKDGKVTFDALFPLEEDLLFGLTIAAVTNSKGPFVTAGDVAKATVFGPALIEVD